MNTQHFSFQSQRHFLQEKTKGCVVSKEELVILKAEYRRLYNTNLKRRTRAFRKHLTVSMSNKEHEQLAKIARDNQVSLTSYVRNASLHIRPQLLPKKELLSLEENILSLLDKIDELREEIINEPESMQAVLTQIHSLDNTIQKLLHYDN